MMPSRAVGIARAGERQGLMELTWIAIVASLLMGGGALLIFIWSVRSHQFKSFEDVKYQVFWSDPQQPPTPPSKEQQHGSSTQDK